MYFEEIKHYHPPYDLLLWSWTPPGVMHRGLCKGGHLPYYNHKRLYKDARRYPIYGLCGEILGGLFGGFRMAECARPYLYTGSIMPPLSPKNGEPRMGHFGSLRRIFPLQYSPKILVIGGGKSHFFIFLGAQLGNPQVPLESEILSVLQRNVFTDFVGFKKALCGQGACEKEESRASKKAGHTGIIQ